MTDRELELLDALIGMLCREREEEVPDLPIEERGDYFRALCNVRLPRPVTQAFLALQDEYLKLRLAARGIVKAVGLPFRNRTALWRGDITRLDADAVVNACNSALLGCFHPLHNCIDNAIHSCAGVQVRLDCAELMRGRQEPPGRVRVTPAYNLPSRYIFHTVGPIVGERVTQGDCDLLASCYRACLNRAAEMELGTLAFCCLSTGVYRFPRERACEIAVGTVREFLQEHRRLRVVFNVFTEEDELLYRNRLAVKS